MTNFRTGFNSPYELEGTRTLSSKIDSTFSWVVTVDSKECTQEVVASARKVTASLQNSKAVVGTVIVAAWAVRAPRGLIKPLRNLPQALDRMNRCYVGYCNLCVECHKICSGYRVLCTGCCNLCVGYCRSHGGYHRRRVGCAGTVRDISTSMWTITTSMWAVTHSVWVIAAYMWDAKSSLWIVTGTMWDYASSAWAVASSV